MKRFMCALALAVSLGACGTDYGYGSGYSGGGYRGGYSYYDGYYDNFYGPVSAGYWGDDGYFYYRTNRTPNYVRDDAHHFRHDRADGWRQFRTRGERPHDSGGRPNDSHDGRDQHPHH